MIERLVSSVGFVSQVLRLVSYCGLSTLLTHPDMILPADKDLT
jgi:hypothetical protein